MQNLKEYLAYFRYIFIAAAAIAIGMFLSNANAEQHRVEQRLRLIERTEALRSNLEREISEKIAITEGVKAAFISRPDMTIADFQRVVGQLMRDASAVINVTAAPDLIIRYVYPMSPNAAALGADLSQMPVFVPGIESALLGRATIFDGPFDLMQDGRGFITRAPVYLNEAATEKGDAWGIVSLVIDQKALFTDAAIEEERGDLAYALQNREGELLSGSADVLNMSPVTSYVVAPGVSWVLSIAPVAGWQATPPTQSALWATIIAAALGSMVLAGLFKSAVRRKDAAEARLSEAIDSLDDGFALYDSQGRFVMANQKYKSLYSSAADLMVPGTAFDVILRRGVKTGQYPQAVGQEEQWIEKRVQAQRSPGQVLEQQLADGRWIRIVERVTATGNVAGFRVDITELKQALARAEAANAAKTDFLNTISHELRTPLTVILGYNAFLREPASLPNFKKIVQTLRANEPEAALENLMSLKTDIEKFAQRIEVSGRELTSLISSILDLATIEVGELEINLEILELAPLVADVADLFGSEAERKGVSIVLDQKAEDVRADPLRLRQILFNLIGNAVKFTDEGVVTIKTTATAERTTIEVSDTGIGLSAREIGFIFERFRQVDASSSRKHGGIGLGLPIARELAKLQNGSIEVSSVVGKGTVFTLDLPTADRGTGAVTGRPKWPNNRHQASD